MVNGRRCIPGSRNDIPLSLILRNCAASHDIRRWIETEIRPSSTHQTNIHTSLRRTIHKMKIVSSATKRHCRHFKLVRSDNSIGRMCLCAHMHIATY